MLTDANIYFENNFNNNLLVNINEGYYEITGYISIRSLYTGYNGRFTLKGAGMNKTTIIFKEIQNTMISIFYSQRITISDIHFTRDQYTVTQGNVVSINKGQIILDIHEGFPTPGYLFDLNIPVNNGKRCYLRRYTKSITDPQVIQENNQQEPFGSIDNMPVKPEYIKDNQWILYLKNSKKMLSNYNIGDLVGIKIKIGSETHRVQSSQYITFENIKFTHSTRGVSRSGVSFIHFEGCRWERSAPINGQMPCMSSPGGGPQMNQPGTISTNMTLNNCFVDSTGDDCVAFFDVNGGMVTNSILRNSFARGIMITSDSNICLRNTQVINSPIQGNYTKCEIPTYTNLIDE